MITFEKFIQSLYDAQKDGFKLHSSEEIEKARPYIGYLTEEELQEVQLTGRFWAFDKYNNLYVIVDNDTIMCLLQDEWGKIEYTLYPRNPKFPILIEVV